MTNKKNDKSHAQKHDQGEDKKKDQTVETGESEKAEAANAAADDAQAAEGDAAGDQSEAKKEVSETDILKIYLQQTMKELDRVKGELETQKKQAEDSKSQAAAIKDKYESVISEYENFRRRTAQEKENIMGEAVTKSVSALLPALDSLERAVEFSESNPESYRQGVEMTLKQLSDGFSKLGVTEIEAKGATFDPSMHNAVMHVEDDTLGESVVAEVFQKGYAVGDRVIRHSVVKVAN